MTRARHPVVIPAKAGIHGLSYRFTKLSLFKLPDQIMDSRLRGNDKVCGCEVG